MTTHRGVCVGLLLLIAGGTSCRDAGPASPSGADYRVTIDYTLTSVDSSLLASEMIWNGVSLHRDSCGGVGTQSSGVIPGVKVGVNTFAIRIANQRVSPSRYSLTGLITAARPDGAKQRFPVEFFGQSLSTGQLVTVVITLTP